jgi:2'-5' RNA ligase
MRAFAGLELPTPLRRELDGWSSLLRAAGPPARWVARDALHLTLRFLGDADADRHLDYALRLEPRLLELPAFELRTTSPGLLPDRGKPRVVMIALACDGPGLGDLAELCERTARECGYVPETRPFRPHVTLCRIKDGAASGGRREWSALLDRFDPGWRCLSSPPFTIGETVLFESVPGAGGSRYTPLRRMALRGLP